MYTILYNEQVVHDDIPKLDTINKKRIQKAIESKLTMRPEIFGLRLNGTLYPYWKLRVGDYRVVFKIETLTVKVLAIGHRSTIYSLSTRRI